MDDGGNSLGQLYYYYYYQFYYQYYEYYDKKHLIGPDVIPTMKSLLIQRIVYRWMTAKQKNTSCSQ